MRKKRLGYGSDFRMGPLNETARAVERCAQGVVKTEATRREERLFALALSDTPWMMAVTVRFAGARLRPEIGRIALLVSTPYRFVILTSSVKRFRLIDWEIFYNSSRIGLRYAAQGTCNGSSRHSC